MKFHLTRMDMLLCLLVPFTIGMVLMAWLMDGQAHRCPVPVVCEHSPSVDIFKAAAEAGVR